MNHDGKEFEQLVRLVEKSISPGSVVEHNVDLPVIGSESGRTCQCDVVIRTGQPPRETVTIVEVQDRTSRVVINDFRGWLVKLEQVGGQHLICVSRLDFPVSVKEEAARHGDTVRLITLRELDADSIPINISFKLQKFDLKKIDIFLTTSKSETEKLGIREAVKKRTEQDPPFGVNERCWSLDKNELVSLFILCRDFFDRPKGNKEGEGNIGFDINEGTELYLCLEGQFCRVGIDCDFVWTYEDNEQPISVLAYEQNEDGVLAWVAELIADTPTGPISVKFPIIEIEGGHMIDAMQVSLPADTTLTMGVIRG